MIGEGGDLRQVRHHQYLAVPPKLCKATTYLNRGRASNAGIDFVEHEGGHRVRVRQNHLQGQHDPRQLTPAGATLDGRERAAAMGTQEKRDIIETGDGRLIPWEELDDQFGIRHGQLGQLGGNGQS
jgi:hypothetical protein